MKLTFVGTGSGKTSLNRFHSSLLISSEENNILIDSGDSISRALLNSKINFNSITDIIISHNHADHFSGLTSLITQMKLSKRILPLNIYTHESSIIDIQKFLNTCFIFQEALAFDLNMVSFNNDIWLKINSKNKILPRKNSHIYNKHKIKNDSINWNSFSFYIESENTRLFYTSDIGTREDLNLFEDLECNYLITETSHISLSDLEEYLDNNNFSKIFLTHIDDSDEEEINRWVNSQNNIHNIIITKDQMVENFDL